MKCFVAGGKGGGEAHGGSGVDEVTRDAVVRATEG